MALPLPGSMIDTLLKGVNTGSSMYTGIMNPILHREQQKQAAEQFKQELALKEKQLAQQGANKDLSRQILQQQLLGLQHANDPMYEMNQYKALENMIKGQGQPASQGQDPQSAPMQAPTQEAGQGMGVFSPEGMAQAQQAAQQQQAPMAQGTPKAGGLNMEILKAHPMLRAFAKKHFGFDPLAQVPQTPEEKQAMALDLFNQKEAIKAKNKGTSADQLTNTTKTKYQAVIGGARSSLPIIDQIIEETRKGNVPGQLIGSIFKRNQQANYKGEVSTLLDGIRNAYTIPNTDSGTQKAEDKVLRKSGESDDNYIKRLQNIRQQIVEREADANAKLGAGNITAKSSPSKSTDYAHMTDEELHKIAGGG